MTTIDRVIPKCPLLSVSTGIDMVCTQNQCAWYIPSVKKCAMYLMGYNALMDANQKQKAK
jgi:hypothetical protein